MDLECFSFSHGGQPSDSGSCEKDVGVTEDAVVKDIFLSHSGKQKNFVEHLYDALQRAHQSAFLDKHDLPKGVPFPDHIKRALRECKLGVVLVTEDFLTSLWPMLELEILAGQDTKVLPLFCGLSTEDLKSSENLSRWQIKWKTLVKDQQQADQWAKAVKKLRSMNGIVYKQQEGQASYIMKVVTEICKIIRPCPLYDMSLIQAHGALTKETVGHFDQLEGCGKARMVGLYGVGGLGKTTLCKSMVNFYASEYLGRSCLIEFPSNCDEQKVAQQCVMGLRRLSVLGEHVLEGVNDFDQVVRLMKEHATKTDIFLAIDNIWADNSEQAGRLLRVGFTAASKVLLTSRSLEVLQSLLFHETESSHICPLPTPELEDAFQIFQRTVDRGDLTSSSVKNEIDNVLTRCRHDGKYHPLALISLGGYVRRNLCGRGASEVNEQEWTSIFREMKNTVFNRVEDVIKLNYDGLQDQQRLIFLDVVAFLYTADWLASISRKERAIFKRFSSPYRKRIGQADARRWLQLLYRTLSERELGAYIHDLATAGVIQKKKNAAGEEKIDVHDLYADLAWKEASGSRRFLMWIGKEIKVWPRNPGGTAVCPKFVTGTEEAMEGTKWEELERAIIVGGKGCRFIDKKLQHCQKLQFLYARGIKLESRILVAPVSDLRVLILSWWAFGSQGEGAPWKMNMNGLAQLEVLELERCPSVYGFNGLDRLHKLRILEIDCCAKLENVDGLSCLTQLEDLQITHCEALTTESLNLGGMTGLKRLWLEGFESLKELRCGGHAIEDFRLESCPLLKRTPDLIAVKTLKLSDMECLQEVGSLNPALRELSIASCDTLRKLPNLGAVTGLQRLQLISLPSLQEVGCLSSALPYLVIHGCPGLGRGDVVELRGAMDSVAAEVFDVERIRIEGCAGIRTLNMRSFSRSFSRRSLRRLEVIGCKELQMIEGFDELEKLEELVLEECGRLQWLKKEPRNASALADLRGTLKKLHISGCPLLGSLPDDSCPF